jgi:hypothetical protein
MARSLSSTECNSEVDMAPSFRAIMSCFIVLMMPVTVDGYSGIGVIGIFTANVASLFFEQAAKSELQEIERRLLAIEQKLDSLVVVEQTITLSHDQQPSARSMSWEHSLEKATSFSSA